MRYDHADDFAFLGSQASGSGIGLIVVFFYNFLYLPYRLLGDLVVIPVNHV